MAERSKPLATFTGSLGSTLTDQNTLSALSGYPTVEASRCQPRTSLCICSAQSHEMYGLCSLKSPNMQLRASRAKTVYRKPQHVGSWFTTPHHCNLSSVPAFQRYAIPTRVSVSPQMIRCVGMASSLSNLDKAIGTPLRLRRAKQPWRVSFKGATIWLNP